MKIRKWIVPAVVLSGTIGLGCSSNRGGDSGQGASSGSRGSSMYSGSQQQQSRSSQLSTSDMRKVEQALKDQGYDPGTVDGRIDSQSQQALRDFQQQHDLTPTGMPDQATAEALHIIIVAPQ